MFKRIIVVSRRVTHVIKPQNSAVKERGDTLEKEWIKKEEKRKLEEQLKNQDKNSPKNQSSKQ